MATHSSILAWEIPWTEEPGGLQSIRLQESQTRLTTEQKQYGCVGSQCIYVKKKDESISKNILIILNIKPKSKHFVFTVTMRIAISLYVFKFYLHFS